MRSWIKNQKAEQAEARRRAEDEASAARGIEQNASRELMADYVFLTRAGVLLSRGKVTSLLHLNWGKVEAALPVVLKPAFTLGGIAYPCVGLDDLILACDAGKFGSEFMGALESYLFSSADELEHAALFRRNIAFLRQGQGSNARGSGPLEVLFDEARLNVVGRAPMADESLPPEQWPVPAQRDAWAAVDGYPSRGPVATLPEAVPFEVVIANRHGWSRIVVIRSMKGVFGSRQSEVWYDQGEIGEPSHDEVG